MEGVDSVDARVVCHHAVDVITPHVLDVISCHTGVCWHGDVCQPSRGGGGAGGTEVSYVHFTAHTTQTVAETHSSQSGPLYTKYCLGHCTSNHS